MQNNRVLIKENVVSTSITLTHYIVLASLIFIAFFYGMTHYLIADLNEGLYAEIAREMLVSHNYIIPHLNYVPYLEKPPLLYWLLAFSYKIFGVNTFAARLIPAASATYTCIFLIYFGQKIDQSLEGWYAATILTTSAGFILLGRVLIFDMLLIACLTTALLNFYLWYINNKTRYINYAYIAVAFAFMTKGLVAIAITSLTAIIFLILVNAPKNKFKALFNPLGILLFLLIVTPWHIAAILKMHGFAWDYFINEQWYRFLNKRVPHDYHTGPIYYYLPRIFIYLFPWSVLLPVIFGKIKGKISQQNPLNIFLWLWFLIPLCIFSLGGDKGDYYMILTTPALAFLLGMKFAEMRHSQIFSHLYLFYGLLFCSGSIIALHLHHLHAVLHPSLILLTICLLIYFGFGLLILNKKTNAFLLIAGFILPIMTFYINVKQDMQNHFTQYTLTHYIQTHDNNRPVYLYQDFEDASTSLFYLQKRLYIVDSQSKDLYYGSHTDEAKGWFITTADLATIMHKQPTFIIIKRYKLKTFQNHISPIKTCVVGVTDKTLLLSNNMNDCALTQDQNSVKTQ